MVGLNLMGMKIVIAEDDRDLQRLYQKILQYGGHQAIVVGHGTRVLAAVKEHQPHVVILDMLLPGIKGNELLREVHSYRSRRGLRMKLIALTGDPRLLEYPEALLADKMLLKPLGMEQLLEIMRTFAEAEQQHQLSTNDAPLPPPTASTGTGTLLVLDAPENSSPGAEAPPAEGALDEGAADEAASDEASPPLAPRRRNRRHNQEDSSPQMMH